MNIYLYIKQSTCCLFLIQALLVLLVPLVQKVLLVPWALLAHRGLLEQDITKPTFRRLKHSVRISVFFSVLIISDSGGDR